MDQHPVQGKQIYFQSLHATETGISSGSYEPVLAPRLHLVYFMTRGYFWQTVLENECTGELQPGNVAQPNCLLLIENCVKQSNCLCINSDGTCYRGCASLLKKQLLFIVVIQIRNCLIVCLTIWSYYFGTPQDSSTTDSFRRSKRSEVRLSSGYALFPPSRKAELQNFYSTRTEDPCRNQLRLMWLPL